MFWPCETRTSTCRNLATISSGLYRFLAITVLLDVKDIPQVGPLRWGLIMDATEKAGIGATLNRCRVLAAKIANELRNKRPEHFFDKLSLADVHASLERAADVLSTVKGSRRPQRRR